MAVMAHVEKHKTPNNLKDWRELHGLTQEDVAALSDYSQSFLSRLESGERNLPPLARAKFARDLGATIRDLFETKSPISGGADK